MKKLEKDGQIAVVYSPGFGAGWSSWAGDEHREALCMDYDIASAVDSGDKEKAAEIAHEKIGDFYDGGKRDLSIYWIDKGSLFEVEEYDGSESIHVVGSRSYLQA